MLSASTQTLEVMPQRMERSLRWFHTVRYLRPVQIYGRILFKLLRPHIDLASPPPRRTPMGEWQRSARRKASLVRPWLFRFLNEEHALRDIGSWNDPAISKLWLYNLHYFDDLNGIDNAQRTDWHRELLLRWVRDNPPGHGTGWEPYPTSLRIVNWIKWTLSGNALPSECLHSLAIQLRWLSQRLENHLLGNHLFANAKALIFGGLFFQGEEAGRWLECGMRILQQEIREQILTDGGHFERSTMYHALALEDVLDLINLVRTLASRDEQELTTFAQQLSDVARPMRMWLAIMSRPDGNIAFFNDAAHDIAPDNVELNRYAQALDLGPDPSPAEGLTHLDPSGYIRVQKPAMVAHLDVAPIGPDYLPGHAHADTLSFELSLHGFPLIVNGGTSRYGLGSERLQERSTAAHNTVEIEGKDSSEVWSGFRVARRAKPVGLQIENKEGSDWHITCSHTGYTRLPGKPLHTRQWVFRDESLTIVDKVTHANLDAIARFHFHPDIAIEYIDNRWRLTRFSKHIATLEMDIGAGATLEASRYAPQFGIVLPRSCLAVRLLAGTSKVRINWKSEHAHLVS